MINLSLYSIFLIASVSTIMSPGPGVLMVVTNAVRLGFWRTLPGICGCAVGTLVVAGISVTGLPNFSVNIRTALCLADLSNH